MNNSAVKVDPLNFTYLPAHVDLLHGTISQQQEANKETAVRSQVAMCAPDAMDSMRCAHDGNCKIRD